MEYILLNDHNGSEYFGLAGLIFQCMKKDGCQSILHILNLPIKLIITLCECYSSLNTSRGLTVFIGSCYSV